MGDEIKLYHVSFDIDNEPLCKQFIPRVPKSCERDEENQIKRICFSDSIERCLDSIGENKLPNSIADKTKIIVWEKVFSLSDADLVDWQYLYENDLVCDAAMTHEYWYKKPLVLEGRYYYILDLEDAIENREKYRIVKPKYRDEIINILLEHGANINELKKLDLCYILNCWIPEHFHSCDIINEKINQAITMYTTIEETDDNKFFQIFGHNLTKYPSLDQRIRNKYKRLEIERV